jgi:hypothetical protein
MPAPYESALAIWESALQSQVVDSLAIGRLPLRPAARRILDEANPFSGSGLETLVRIRLRWMRLRILSQIIMRAVAQGLHRAQ